MLSLEMVKLGTSEVPSFTISKDMIGTQFKNGSRDPDHAPFKDDLSALCRI